MTNPDNKSRAEIFPTLTYRYSNKASEIKLCLPAHTRLIKACIILVVWMILVMQIALSASPLRVDLRPALHPDPVRIYTGEPIAIKGKETTGGTHSITITATDALGRTSTASAQSADGAFTVSWPSSFEPKLPFVPGPLYLDASHADDPDARSEILLLLLDPESSIPDLPQLFCDDFLSAEGATDQQAPSWERNRALVNHFMRSRAAKIINIGRADFDIAKKADFNFFKQYMTLYDFDYRDRNWSTPLRNRPAQGFVQAVWDGWFNPTNSHFWDGNTENRAPENFRPYTFTNDLSDLLIVYQMLRGSKPHVPDNREQLTEDLLENLIALQHRGDTSFSLSVPGLKPETYTAGAFRYGMFESGEWLTETKGWFVNPKHNDFAHGGVFNGRAMWALGESLLAYPDGPQRQATIEAIQEVLRFCFFDGQKLGYTELTANGNPFWTRPGEQGYLVQGMLAASAVYPSLPIPTNVAGETITLEQLTKKSLNALTEKVRPNGIWTHYSDCDAVNLTALAKGAMVFPDAPDKQAWIDTAEKAALTWLDSRPMRNQAPDDFPLFGHTLGPDGMNYKLGSDQFSHVSLYSNGHWLHALSILHQAKPNRVYREKATSILAYYCGNNNVHARLYNELGAVYNRLTDLRGNGKFETLGWDAYPESTAFFQIGLMHYMNSLYPQQR